MKFINYLSSIEGVGIYPMISFVIFFSVFLFVLYMVVRASRKEMDHMSQMPLETDETENN